MTKQIIEILVAAIAIATGLPREPHRPLRPYEDK